jgi:hypothetical protein
MLRLGVILLYDTQWYVLNDEAYDKLSHIKNDKKCKFYQISQQ